jgi:hypothetical protein
LAQLRDALQSPVPSSGTYLARRPISSSKIYSELHKLWCAVLGLK